MNGVRMFVNGLFGTCSGTFFVNAPEQCVRERPMLNNVCMFMNVFGNGSGTVREQFGNGSGTEYREYIEYID